MSKFAPPAPPFIPARFYGGDQTPRAIVIHGTVSHDDRGTARNIANWWHGPTSPKTSAHYVADPGEVIQSVGDHTVAFHCGYNTGSIAVELCDEQTGPASRWADADSKAILKRAARLVADLCLAYDIDPARPSIAELKAHGPHGIYGHNDSRLAFGNTTHSDPGPDFPWGAFLADVRRLVAEAKKPAPAPAPVKRKTATLRVVDWNVQRDRGPKTVLAELQHLAATADVMTLQEVGGYHEELTNVGGFTVAAFADDCAVLVRLGHKVESSCAVQVTTRGWFTVRGGQTGPKSAAACIVDGIGCASVHTPPTVQSKVKRLAAPRRWAAYRELMTSMPALVAHLGPRCVVAGDWNVDAGSDKGTLTGWPLKTFANLPQHLRRHVPKDGTHGKRVIDYVFARNVHVGAVRVVDGHFGSDHRPISFSVHA